MSQLNFFFFFLLFVVVVAVDNIIIIANIYKAQFLKKPSALYKELDGRGGERGEYH